MNALQPASAHSGALVGFAPSGPVALHRTRGQPLNCLMRATDFDPYPTAGASDEENQSAHWQMRIRAIIDATGLESKIGETAPGAAAWLACAVGALGVRRRRAGSSASDGHSPQSSASDRQGEGSLGCHEGRRGRRVVGQHGIEPILVQCALPLRNDNCGHRVSDQVGGHQALG